MKINTTLRKEIRSFIKNKIQEEKAKITVYVPYTLTSDDKESIQSLLSKKEISDVRYVIDKDIFAGIIIQYGSKLLDLSLRSGLKNLQKRMYETY